MLFDLRGRGRRRTVQAIYLGLAVLMGGGLVFFGIGGGTSGGFLDAFKGGGGSTGPSVFDTRVKAAERQVALAPSNPAAWAQLAGLRFQLAGVGQNYDQNVQAFTAKARPTLLQAKAAWDRYLALTPTNPSPDLANKMIDVLGGRGGLNDFAGAARAAEILASARPSVGTFGALAELAYAAKETRKGDLASAKAMSLAQPSQRATIRAQLQQIKSQASGAASTPGAATSGATPGATSGANSGTQPGPAIKPPPRPSRTAPSG
jgi:hypothetical protein